MPLSPAARASALAFLIAFVTLFSQILAHRMISAKLLNNYAFLVISLTMLGFAGSGVLLTRWSASFRRNLDETIGWCTAGLALLLVTASAVLYRADIGVQGSASREDFLLALLAWTPVALLYAVPFACAGLMLGLLLSLPDVPARRVYGFDLLGSALGALAVLPAIDWLGVERSALLGCLLLVGGVAGLARLERPVLRGAAVFVALGLCAAFLVPDEIFSMHYQQHSLLARAHQKDGRLTIEHVLWDPLSRVEVSRIAPPNPEQSPFPSLLGERRSFLERLTRVITQNNYAFTYAPAYDGTPASLQGIEDTIYAATYQATSMAHPDVLVIGVGGGYDVLSALAFGAGHVTGVEINGATLRVLKELDRDYFSAWAGDPRVQLVHDEGRHFLESSARRYDVIQLSEVGTYSGMPGIAHVFTENHLYTAEAFDAYLSKLSDNGLLSIMRLETPYPRILLRTVITAVEALRRAGAAEPERHIIVLMQRNGRFGSLLVKKTPFAEPELRRVHEWAASNKFLIPAAGPDGNAHGVNPYQAFLALTDPARERFFLAQHPFDIAPVTDNRPFFFRFSFWSHLLPDSELIRKQSIPVMEYSVLLLGGFIGLAAMLCVALPLKFLAGEGLRIPDAARYAAACAGLGLGYMAIEIAFLQKFGLVLGHPNYSLSVVLASLLVATGAGSLYADRLLRAAGHVRIIGYALAGILLIEYGLAFPWLPKMMALPWIVRAGLVAAMTVPAGICLGVFFPTILDRLKQTNAAAFVPWAWGINGIFSVLGPVLAVGLSITWGINALLLSAIPIYLMVGFVLPDETRAG
jgi:spermidine synthase